MLHEEYISKFIRKYTQVEDTEEDFESNTLNFSFTIKVKDFRYELLHTPGDTVIFEELVPVFKIIPVPFIIKLYPNGKSIKQQNYVSVVFSVNKFPLPKYYLSEVFELVCTLSVIDASQKDRFPQSCVFLINGDPTMKSCDMNNLAFDQFLKHSTILNDSADLLPDDCLTLQIDVIIRVKYLKPPENNFDIHEYFTATFSNYKTMEKHFLRLDSHLAKSLARVSTFFQTILEITMVENKTGLMEIPKKYTSSIIDASDIFMGCEEIKMSSVINICQMYELAHLYDIPPVIKSCRNLLRTILRIETYQYTVKHITENKEMLFDFVELYEEKQLKEDITSFLKFNPEESEQERSSKKSLHSNLDTEWKLELHLFEEYDHFLFTRYKQGIEMKPEDDCYDFYH